jgi:dTDP-4-amino-4,6-dideoxygalactose transaminase
VRAARNYGDLGAYDPELLGLSARMPEYNAALALAGLPLVDKKVCRHNEIASAYTRLLTGIPGLTFQNVREQDTCTYKDYSVRVNADDFGLSRDELASALLAENIETKKYFYPPMHKQSLYKQYYSPATSPLTSTDWVADGVLSLPIYESLPDHTVERIASAVRRVFNWVRTHS